MMFAYTRRRVSIEIGVLLDLAAIASLLVLCFALSYWPGLLRSVVDWLLSPFALDRVQLATVGVRLTGLLLTSRMSFITAAIMLVAMLMSTRRFQWWRWALAALLPLIYGYGTGYITGPLTRALQAAGMTDGWYIGIYTAAVRNLLLAAIMAWLVRSRLVFAGGVLAAAMSAVFTLWIIHNMPIVPGTNGGRDSPPWQFMVVPSIQSVIAVSLVVWAWRSRNANPVKGLCWNCGFDLRGTAHVRCPECGAAAGAIAPV